MPILIPIAISIGTAIGTAIATVAAVVAAVAVAIGTALAAVAAFVAGAVASIVGGVIASITWAASGIISGISAVYTAVMPTITTIYKGFMIYAKAIVSGMKAFLEAIHFKLILKIHNLGMIFSNDYRELIAKIYHEISMVSDALGLGAHFMNLILNDARNVVMDASSLMGRSYDLGEVQWLSQMNGFLKDFASKAEEYKNHPSKVLQDLNTWVGKPSIDAKASFQRSFLTIVDGVVTVADKTAAKVVTLREDLEQAILHLPKSISREIYDKINPVFEGFDRFIEDEYKPVSRDLSNAIRVISDTSQRQTDKLNVLTQNILNPGDMLGNIDNLTGLEKIRQEAKIAEIAARAPLRSAKEVNEKVDTAHKGIKEIFEAITKIRPKPPYYVKESKGLQYKPGMTPAYAKSWFVGDF